MATIPFSGASQGLAAAAGGGANPSLAALQGFRLANQDFFAVQAANDERQSRALQREIQRATLAFQEQRSVLEQRRFEENRRQFNVQTGQRAELQRESNQLQRALTALREGGLNERAQAGREQALNIFQLQSEQQNQQFLVSEAGRAEGRQIQRRQNESITQFRQRQLDLQESSQEISQANANRNANLAAQRIALERKRFEESGRQFDLINSREAYKIVAENFRTFGPKGIEITRNQLGAAGFSTEEVDRVSDVVLLARQAEVESALGAGLAPATPAPVAQPTAASTPLRQPASQAPVNLNPAIANPQQRQVPRTDPLPPRATIFGGGAPTQNDPIVPALQSGDTGFNANDPNLDPLEGVLRNVLGQLRGIA